MAYDSRSLEDYVDVAERLTEFYERYPDGSLQPADPLHPWEQATVTGYDKDGKEVTQTFVVYTAMAYRDREDTRPGVGVAWEVFPGRTPYTRGSEIMNSETSAWGRAMAALGIATKRGIASRQEVGARRAEREDGLPVNRDGSLSRSQTTDAEKDAAGVMTSGQQAEHTALQPKRDKPATRLRAVPDDDPWYQGGPPSGADQRDYSSAATATPADIKRLHQLYRQVMGDRPRALRLADVALSLGLAELKSFSDLSHEQAKTVIERLEAKVKP